MSQTYDLIQEGTINNNTTANVELQSGSNNWTQWDGGMELHIAGQTYGTSVGYAAMYIWFNENYTPAFPGASYNSTGYATIAGSSLSIYGGPNRHDHVAYNIGQNSGYGTASSQQTHTWIRMWDVVGSSGSTDQDRYMNMVAIANLQSGWTGSAMSTSVNMHHIQMQQYDYDLRGVHNIRFGYPSSYKFASGSNYQLYGIKYS